MKKRKIIGLGIFLPLAGLLGYYFYPGEKLPGGTQIDRIVVHKSKRKMMVYCNGELQKTYKIALGRVPVGHKEYEGDMKTPEGIYTINDKNPYSGYHKNLGVSYPEEKDIKNARRLGKPTGGDIKIHGLRNGSGYIGKFHRWTDWTHGCIAVTDKEMDELYESVKIGATIEIKP